MRPTRWLSTLVTVLLGAACATATPPPTNLLVESRTSVRVAEQAGAETDPEAARYLALARRQIADAERHIAEGSQWSANRSLEAAQVNAELAGELARQANARAQAEQAQREIEDLRRQP